MVARPTPEVSRREHAKPRAVGWTDLLGRNLTEFNTISHSDPGAAILVQSFVGS